MLEEGPQLVLVPEYSINTYRGIGRRHVLSSQPQDIRLPSAYDNF
jgi:hypothetical protein